MKTTTKILIIDDERPIVEALSAALKDDGFVVDSASGGRQGLEKIREFSPDIVLQDIWMPGDMDGLQVLEEAKKGGYPDCQFIIMSGHGTIETAVRAVKNGAWDFVEKPLSMDKISILIANILNFKRELSAKNALLSKLRKNIALIGESPVMVNLKQMIARVATSNAWILVTGENGTGKELVAQNIHYLSHRAARPLVEVNCAAIPKDLIEAELFGYEKGAFTGAERAKKGKFDLANGGTLFLDEIADMSLDAQAKILRILQEQKFYRVGGEQPIDIDVRVVAATNKNLEEEIKQGRFREDLFYRLNVVPLRVAPLRQRKEDIVLLADYFGDQFLRNNGYKRKVFSDGAMQMMQIYPWPGNVREFRNFIERVYILTPGDYVDVHDLRFAGLTEVTTSNPEEAGLMTFREARARFEREFLLQKIGENQGNISKTAESIGLERSYLHRKIKAYGIEV
ncbi:MAG: sigma-54-dependent transcriptional regulator [Bdellovibrionales bacterium]